jgi:hypothetical protein
MDEMFRFLRARRELRQREREVEQVIR